MPTIRAVATVMAMSIMLAAAGTVARPAQAAEPGRSGRVGVQYVAPANPLHKRMYDKLRGERWLERMADVLDGFRLPRAVTLKLTGCDGEVDAWFQSPTIAVCYEYLHIVARRAEAKDLPTWVSGEEAMAGAFVDAFLHEFAHALFEYHRVPILGREEDAADQVSAVLMLKLGGPRADSFVRGTAVVYLSWIRYFQGRRFAQTQPTLASGARLRAARQHSSAAQRLYNLVCLAYGADARRYAVLAKAVELPGSRAEDCPDEHAQVTRAYRTLIEPLWDRNRHDGSERALQAFIHKR